MQHNNTVEKLEGQSNQQGTSWLLGYIILELHWFFFKKNIYPANKYNACSPRKTQIKIANSKTNSNLGYSKRQLIIHLSYIY